MYSYDGPQFPNEILYLPLSEDPATVWYNRHSPQTPLLTTHSAADHFLEPSPPPYCPPTTYWDDSKCVLSINKSIIHIYIYIDVYIYIYIDVFSKQFHTQNSISHSAYTNYAHNTTQAYSFGFWLKIYYVYNGGWSNCIWGDSYVMSIRLYSTQMQMRARRSDNNYFIHTWNPITHNVWHYYAMSVGNYIDHTYIYDTQYHIIKKYGYTLGGYYSNYLYFCHSWLGFYVRDIFFYKEYSNVNQLIARQYRTNSDSLSYKRIFRVDFKYLGRHSAGTRDDHNLLRCPTGSRLSYNYDSCIVGSSLAIIEKMNLCTSPGMSVTSEGTFEFVFKIRKWGDGGSMTLAKFDTSLNINLAKVASHYKIQLYALDADYNQKFNITPTWNIQLDTQYHFALAFDTSSVNIYLNKQLQAFTAVIIMIYIYIIYYIEDSSRYFTYLDTRLGNRWE